MIIHVVPRLAEIIQAKYAEFVILSAGRNRSEGSLTEMQQKMLRCRST
jgi:hypothetical protein